ncbi:MAG: hypothetical protein IIA88_03650 [Bacteroidetes bacterium]|nr:hypothetical protein [Bacteroidota bacterium]
MSEKYLTERIRLFTEWGRGLFAFLILDSTGIASLLVRQEFITNNVEYKLLILVIILFIIIFVMIVIINLFIIHFINSLKK